MSAMIATTALPLNDILLDAAYHLAPAALDEALVMRVTPAWLFGHVGQRFNAHAAMFGALIRDFVEEVYEDGGACWYVTATPYMLACLWDDLARLAQVAAPESVLALLTDRGAALVNH